MGDTLGSTDNIELPELIHLPVYREDYITQEQVDELCKLVWKELPVMIRELTLQEKRPFPDNRDAKFTKPIYHIIDFLRGYEKASNIEPISLTGMVDLTYEIDRRVRYALGLKDIQPIGISIASTLEDPFPPLVQLPVGKSEDGTSSFGATQERADAFCIAAYVFLIKHHSEVVFSLCELDRRYLRQGEPDSLLYAILYKEFIDPFPEFVHLLSELKKRLSVLIRTDKAYEYAVKEYNNE